MRRMLAVAAAAAASFLALPGTAQAAETTYVPAGDLGQPQTACSATPSGWCTFTRALGTVRLVDGAEGTPPGQHLELSTPPVDSSTDSKAYALEYDDRGPLSEITTLAYQFLVTSPGANNADQAPAINVEITTADGISGVLVYEPVYVDGYHTSTAWTTQIPTTATGGWWATGDLKGRLRAAQDDPGKDGGATWLDVQDAFPGATVGGIGVNQGGGNPGLTSQVDLLTVNDTTYDFGAPVVETPEPPAKPLAADDCKNGGWKTYTEPAFPNQGQCIQFVNTGKYGQGSANAPTPAPVKPSSAVTPSSGKVRAA